MPLVESDDFAAKDFSDLGKLEPDHTFKGANTGIAWLLNLRKQLTSSRVSKKVRAE